MSVESSLAEINFVNLYDEKKTSKVKQKETFYIHNRFGSSKKLKITLSKTSHSAFHLLGPSDERCVAAGLKVPVVLQYAPETTDTHTGEVQVYVNEQLSLTLPIQALPPSPCIRVGSTLVDFGCLVAEHQVVSQRFTVSNDGAREGGFTIATTFLPPHFTLSASEGKLGPKKTLEIQVELVCKHCGPFKEELSVVPLNGGAPITVSLCGELVTRELQLLDQNNSTALNKISFGDTYYDTVVSRNVILFNNSPVATQYVAVLDSSGVGGEAGVDMSEGLAMACTSGGLGQRKWREQGDAPGQETVLSLNPSQGNLGPYEKAIVELLFMPTFVRSEVGWSQHQGHPTQRDYALFVKFLQVEASTGVSGLEVALTGRACPVMLSFKPEGLINFGTCNTGSSSTVDLQVLNESLLLPVEYQCRALAHYKFSPRSGRLLPGEVTSVPVTFTPKQLGKLNCKLNLDVMGANREADGKIRTSSIYTAVIDLRGVGGVSSAVKKDRKIRLAHPNDLSTSIRPHDEQNDGVIITPYTGVARHTYVDSDYSPTKREAASQAQLKNTYTSFIRDTRTERLRLEKDRRHTGGASVDISMAPAQGLCSPALSTTDLGEGGETGPRGVPMATIRDVARAIEDQLEFVSECPSKPVNAEVAAQVNKTLSPRELSQVVIDPGMVDFGSVVVNSTVEFTLSVRNSTTNHIKLKMKLTGSSVTCGDKTTLQLIVPSLSYTRLPLSMSPSHTGIVERSIEYSVNGGSSGHLPVKASVTQLSLTLSSHTLTLTEAPLARQNSGLQGSVVVSNPHSIPAFFRWLAKEGVETSIFNVLHPSGHVPANGNLECAFVCDPSYQSPDMATFQLDDGSQKDTQPNTLTLVTEFKRPVCNFRERRVLFGTIPLNLTTSQTIHIDNTGDCHAYYKVLDTPSHPGLRVEPESGVVPRGGAATLQVLLCPESVGTVDMRVVVGLRGGRKLSLRLAGMVNQPMLYLDEELFRFGSVFCGAKATHSFTVHNKGSTVAELTFELAQLSDFSLLLPVSEDPYNEPAAKTDNAGTYSLKIPGKSMAVCQLQFCPKEVAAYDFLLPVLVNGTKAPPPPPIPWPPSHTSSYIAHSQETDSMLPSFARTPVRRVLATALKPPLVVSNLQFDFNLTLCDTPTPHDKTLTLSNVSDKPLSWALGKTTEANRVENETFQFALPSGQPFQPPLISPNGCCSEAECILKPEESVTLTVLCKPRHHGRFSATLPLIVNGNTSQPYHTLELTAHLPPSTIRTTPSSIDLLPVPLGVSLTAQFSVIVQGFAQPVELEVAVPAMSEGVCFSVSFPGDSRVNNKGDVELPCRLEFSATKPVSISDTIIFSDKITGKKKVLPFTVCADNSLFSVYKFLAQNVHLSTVTLASNVPTLVLQNQSLVDFEQSSSVGSRSSQGSRAKETALSFNTSITFSDMFHQDCVSAVCRWMSAYGWSDGTRCISTPSDFRLKVGNDLPKPGVKQRSCISISRGLLVDMLTHLCGRVPPGIPINLPPCTTASEKVNQQYSTVNTVISFLKSQGGLLWSVVPEALLDWCDYCQWLSDVGSRGGSVGFQPVSEEEFNELSIQAWTHLLMQIVKVLVLPRAVSQVSKVIKDSVQNGSTLESNVYSRHERVLLAWLNHHYAQQKSSVFTNTVLSLTEVLNFDVDLMDCTVFACVLASYCPFLVDSHLQQLFTEPANQEQCTHNAIILIRALMHTGIEYDIQPSDLVSPDPISLLLFTVFLCQRLPAFKSKSSTVLFQGALSAHIKNQVKLSNPSTKTLQYRVLIRGGSPGDFTVQEDTITVGGKQSGELTVDYHARCLAPAQATLLLVAKGGRAVAGSTLAFKLVGRTTNFKPQTTVQLTACQYEGQSSAVRMVNTLGAPGHFSVRLYQMESKKLIQSMSPRSIRRLSAATPAAIIMPTSVLQQGGDDELRQFHCPLPQAAVHLDVSKSTVVPVKFVPLTTDSQHCFIVLSDQHLGDIVALLASTVQSPRPTLPCTNSLNSHTLVNPHTRTLHLKVHAGQTIEEELVVHSNNEAFECAVLEMSQWGMSREELTRRQLTHSLRYAALSTAVAALGLEGTSKSDDHKRKTSEMLHFTVHVSDEEHFKLPHEIAVPAKSSGTAVLPVQFCSEKEGQFDCYVTLQSQHDVRVLVIETTVLATGRHAHLQFNTPAMQPLTQDIPLVNPSTADWPLIVSLSGSGFSGPECLIARALTTTTYPLTFHPHAQGTVEGVLHLLNNGDGSEHVFQLTGLATKPLAQDHITLHATANQSLTHIVHVPNHNERTTEFRIESDLDFVSGPSTITVGGGDVVDYCLTVHPKRRGTFTGAIAFITEAVSSPHSYHERLQAAPEAAERSPYRVWFHLKCVVAAAPPDHVLTLSTPALSSTTLQLTVPNPHPHPLTLEVLVEGVSLSGPDSLQIEPQGEATYPLTFSPKLHGKTTGRVVFNGGPDGELWYKLVLSAEDPRPIVLPTLQCELGRTEVITITLRNPLEESVQLSCDNSNTRHFVVTGLPEGQVMVDPHSSAEVSVIFSPSSLGTSDHTTDLTFTSSQMGRQMFCVTGEGLPPTSMDPIIINAAMDASAVHIISFINPLDHPTHFSITLKGKDSDAFCLLLKRTSSILLRPGVSLDIPIMFAPDAVHRHSVTVTLTADLSRSQYDNVDSQPLCWQYSVVGQPQLRPFSPGSALKISCSAKERLEKTLEVSLTDCAASAQVTPTSSATEVAASDDAETDGAFTFKLVCSDSQFEELIDQCTGVRLIRQTTEEDKGITLEFGIVFTPSKSFSCVCELQVTCVRNGGVWLFPLQFSARAAALDDTITIEARGLHKESCLGFRLTSGNQHPVSFTAHLTPGSDSDITVTPTSGTLPPIDTNGLLFCVSYKPATYGRPHTATLIVQSETNEWRYRIVGQPPKYARPVVPAKVQHKINSLMTLSSPRKNFVTENINVSS